MKIGSVPIDSQYAAIASSRRRKSATIAPNSSVGANWPVDQLARDDMWRNRVDLLPSLGSPSINWQRGENLNNDVVADTSGRGNSGTRSGS